ncbi:hypothetical protein BJ165DRAFT_1530765 [Panaeolus papilionaceus]|nr:hypothetical protein BJ165DRAFT_1530765 [Panaeolus papilionaceus]
MGPLLILQALLSRLHHHLYRRHFHNNDHARETLQGRLLVDKWYGEASALEGCREDVVGLVGRDGGLLKKEEREEAVTILGKAFEASGQKKRPFLQFIESLAPDQHLDISKDSLESVTQEVNCYQVVNLGLQYDDKMLFVLMDTPGFLDPRLSEGRIMRMVTESLNAIRQFSGYTVPFIFYFQPITDIRIGGSKQDAVKILQEYVHQYEAAYISVITTMWNQLLTPKQLEDASHRFNTLKEEIYARSPGFGITVTKFDTSQASALSLLNDQWAGWLEDPNNTNKVIDPHYQSHLCNNLLGRITNTLQKLQLLAEDKQHATCSGSEDHHLLEVVLRDEKVALSSLQSFLDDLVGCDPQSSGVVDSTSGLMALWSLLDTCYEQDPDACSSSWLLSQALLLAPPILLPTDATPQSIVASDIVSKHNPAPASPLQVPGLHQLSITPVPTQPIPNSQPSSSDASCFASITAAIKR